jgi:hypothetical protein
VLHAFRISYHEADEGHEEGKKYYYKNAIRVQMIFSFVAFAVQESVPVWVPASHSSTGLL